MILLLVHSIETPQIFCLAAFRKVPTWSPKGNPLFHRRGADDVAMGATLPPRPDTFQVSHLLRASASPRIEHSEMCSGGDKAVNGRNMAEGVIAAP